MRALVRDSVNASVKSIFKAVVRQSVTAYVRISVMCLVRDSVRSRLVRKRPGLIQGQCLCLRF